MRLTSPRLSRPFRIFLLNALLLSLAVPLIADDSSNAQFSGLKWRLIGPFPGGRLTAVAGVPGDTRVHYFGTPGGGIWKTTDGGRVWRPIFDDVRVPSIGA